MYEMLLTGYQSYENRSDKIKPDFFQAVAVSILLNGCTTWRRTKDREKTRWELHKNTVCFNKSWKQSPTKHQLYGHLLSILQTIQLRQTRHKALLKKQGQTHQ